MGFPKEMFLNPEDVTNLLCPICEEVVEDARLDQCSHTFCYNCISNSLKKEDVCPISKNEIKESNLIKVFMFADVLGSKDVRCSFTECEWKGKFNDFLIHRAKDCQFREIGCTNNNCSVKVKRKDLEDHLQKCVYAEANCDYCGAKSQIISMFDHHMVCPEITCGCPYECNELVVRKLIPDHEKICPNFEIPCRFAEKGCTHIGPRRELIDHDINETQNHEQLLIDEITSLRKELTELQVRQANKNEVNKPKPNLKNVDKQTKVPPKSAKKEPEPTVKPPIRKQK